MTVDARDAARAPALDPGSRVRRVWGEVWRVLAAAGVGLATALMVAYEVSVADRAFPEYLWLVDLGLGLVGLCLLPLRRKAPLTIALVLCAASVLSSSVVGAEAIAVISLATHRRWWRIGVAGVAFVLAGSAFAHFHPYVGELSSPVIDVVSNTVIYALLVWIGAYIGLRRDHLASLHDRALTAEREQASRAAQARANERARIAREMHDVLAHRISLVAMHAGALSYRTDLPPEQVAETAAVVQSNAHAALEELRDVLGVLRAEEGTSGESSAASGPQRPQPTLVELDELVSETRASGVDVRLESTAAPLADLPEAVSRNAYRIVQEALTNARKHAPWARVTLEVTGAPGPGLSVSVRNPVRSVGTSAPDERPPSSGLGLVGLTERAELSGGRLDYGEVGGTFVVSAWLPWAA